jgi:hypothetical protein
MFSWYLECEFVALYIITEGGTSNLAKHGIFLRVRWKKNLVLFQFLKNLFSGPSLFFLLKPSQFYDAAND